MSAAVSMHLNAPPQRQQAGGRRQGEGGRVRVRLQSGWRPAKKKKKQKREQNVVQKKQDKTFDLGEIQSDNK